MTANRKNNLIVESLQRPVINTRGGYFGQLRIGMCTKGFVFNSDYTTRGVIRLLQQGSKDRRVLAEDHGQMASYLRRYIRWGPKKRLCQFAGSHALFAKSIISQLDMAISVYEDVFGFEISVEITDQIRSGLEIVKKKDMRNFNKRVRISRKTI